MTSRGSTRHADTSGAATEELATDCRLLTAAGGEVWVHAVVRRVTDSRAANSSAG